LRNSKKYVIFENSKPLTNMNLEIIALERLVNDLKYEVDRLRHEVKLLTINSESHDRRLDMQVKTNDLIFKEVKNVREDIK